MKVWKFWKWYISQSDSVPTGWKLKVLYFAARWRWKFLFRKVLYFELAGFSSLGVKVEVANWQDVTIRLIHGNIGNERNQEIENHQNHHWFTGTLENKIIRQLNIVFLVIIALDHKKMTTYPAPKVKIKIFISTPDI